MSFLLDESSWQKEVSQFPTKWFLICETLLYLNEQKLNPGQSYVWETFLYFLLTINK